MKLALIPPMKYIWFAESCDHHLLLSHLIDNTQHGRLYRKFYMRLPKDHYKILDNGAHENDQGDTIRHTLRKAIVLGRVQEVVMPDAQQDGAMTVVLGHQATDFLVSDEGQKLYLEAGRPRLMWVPQGRSVEEWVDCCHALMFAHDRLVTHEYIHERPVIGLAKKHTRYLRFMDIIEFCVHRDLDMHMLGWPDGEAVELGAYYGVRSIDTAKPFVYSIEGIDAAGTRPLPEVARPADYFNVNWDVDMTLLQRNVDFFKQGIESLPIKT